MSHAGQNFLSVLQYKLVERGISGSAKSAEWEDADGVTLCLTGKRHRPTTVTFAVEPGIVPLRGGLRRDRYLRLVSVIESAYAACA